VSIPRLDEVTSLLGAGIAEAKNAVRNRSRKTLLAALWRERTGRAPRVSMTDLIERELRRRDRLRAKPDLCANGCGVQRVPKRTKIVCPKCGAWDDL